MSIEVKQLVVKSNIVQREQGNERRTELAQEELQKMILAECKKLIVATVREMKER